MRIPRWVFIHPDSQIAIIFLLRESSWQVPIKPGGNLPTGDWAKLEEYQVK